MKLPLKLLMTALLICIVFPLSVVTHEFGHAITGLSLGLNKPTISVWPGWQIYPEFDSSGQDDWPRGNIAQTRFSFHSTHLRIENSLAYHPQNIQFKAAGPVFSVSVSDKGNGLILLMGSGLNWLLSILALYLLFRFKRNQWVLVSCTPIALLYYDLVFYTLLPPLFNLKHLIFWGGEEAEPLIALTQLGINQYVTLTLISGIGVVQSLLIYKALKANQLWNQNQGKTSIEALPIKVTGI